MKLIFSKEAWSDYQYWKKHDPKKVERIKKLLKDIKENPFQGIGKPEPLKLNLRGKWSRRINSEHRLVYEIHKDRIEIGSCRYHYK